MRVLLADSDRRLTDLMVGTLEAIGHTVAVSGDGLSLERSLARNAPDVLILDVDHGHGGGSRIATAWRETATGRQGVVLLMGGRDEADSRVAEVRLAVDAREYLKKPFSLLDLGAILERIGPVAQAPLPAARARVRQDVAPRESGLRNLTQHAAAPRSSVDRVSRGVQRVARLWADRASGTIVLADGGGRFRMAGGGLVDPGSWEGLSTGLRAGGFRFEPGHGADEGDADATGRALFGLAHGEASAAEVMARRFDRLVLDATLEILVSLPLHPRTLASLGVAGDSVGAVLAEADELTDLVAAELHALVLLGLLSLQPRGAVGRGDTDKRRDASVGAGVPTGAVHTVARTGGRRAPVSGPGSGVTKADFRRGRLTSTGGRSLSDARSSVARGRSGVRDALRRSATVARRRTASSMSSGVRAPAGTPARLHRQLKGELGRLVDAPPAVVLGIPSDSDADLVEQAAARLRARYTDLAERPGLPTPVRVISRRLAELVDDAHRAMVLRARSRRDDGLQLDGFEDRHTDVDLRPVASEEERLLSMGEKLLAQERWEQADKVLTRAQDLCLGHAGILSGLAWARMHSPSRPPEARMEEARDLLLLAEQFGGSDDAVMQRRLAFVYLAEGKVEKASIRGKRALRLAPQGEESARLRRALEAATAPTS